MPSFSAKDYQRSCLKSMRSILRSAKSWATRIGAFQKTTEELSGGKCLYVMATDKDWKVITEKMG